MQEYHALNRGRSPLFQKPQPDSGFSLPKDTSGDHMVELIERAKMPQIDATDLPELLVFLGSRGVGLSAGLISPYTFTSHQAIDRAKVDAMPLSLLSKPILASGDWGILDGNHRWAKHRAVGSNVPYLQVLVDFDSALEHLYAFPKTYEYGDGKFHPERN